MQFKGLKGKEEKKEGGAEIFAGWCDSNKKVSE